MGNILWEWKFQNETVTNNQEDIAEWIYMWLFWDNVRNILFKSDKSLDAEVLNIISEIMFSGIQKFTLNYTFDIDFGDDILFIRDEMYSKANAVIKSFEYINKNKGNIDFEREFILECINDNLSIYSKKVYSFLIRKYHINKL